MSDGTNPFAEANADPFIHDDAAYVLGALSPEERAAFELHLRDCDACLRRVQELSGMASLLQDVTEADLLAIDERPPDTLLPRLMREASARRRRSRTFIGALAAVAAACAISLVVVLWPSSSAPAPAGRPFTALVQTPVAAKAVLASKAWGTSIELNCRYVHSGVDHAWTYELIVYDRAGNKHFAGDWTVPPDKDISYMTGTSLRQSDISRLVIALPDGKGVLRLNT
jgi:anti-sigma-K factor RskA